MILAAFLAAALPAAAEDSTALARAGIAAIDAGRFGDALEAFTKASTLRPDDAGLCFGAGIAAFMLGRDDLAQARLECALALKPDYLAAAEWLGDLHYRAGRLSSAIAIYDTARRLPRGRALEGRLETWRKEHAVESRFTELRSARFTALFDTAIDEPRARDVLDRLEAAYWRVGTLLGVYPTRRITIVLYTRGRYRDITRLAGWSVAAYDGRIRVPLDDSSGPAELDRLLSHEFVHAVVATIGGRAIPAWLNEGLATVLEPVSAVDAEEPDASPDGHPPLSQLHRGFIHLSRSEARIAYAAAARAVRRLIDARGLATLVELLDDLGRGAAFDGAFQQHIGMRYEEFAVWVARD